MIRDSFPDNFVFGTATSAYQIEGGVNEGGRKPSIWDTFSHTPGKVLGGDTGDIACDHYHRYKDDVSLMANMGLGGYRFSTSWSRVLPAGYGKINPTGMDFYSRLVDELLEKGIKPFITLYHWDLPQALEEKGGWLNRDTTQAFQEYAAVMAEHLGDRVDSWMTHNELWCASFLSYQIGMFAPGHKDWHEALTAAHHLLLSHGLAVEAMRDLRADLQLGIAPNYLPSLPENPQSEDDCRAASNFDGYFNRWFFDPLVGRGYPSDMIEIYQDSLDFIGESDMSTIAAPIDFIGFNYYNTNWYTLDSSALPLCTKRVEHPDLDTTKDRDVYPEGLYLSVRRIWKDYGFKNIYLTENGAAFDDQLIVEKGVPLVHDKGRVKFLEQHFAQAARLLVEGAPLRGFFVWSLMDNFEWAAGYSVRYGLHYTDFKTQKRTPKDSALWYRDFIKGK